MAITKKSGHATTSVLAGTDHAVVKPAQPSFVPTQGPADNQSAKAYGGQAGDKVSPGGKKNRSFPPAS